MKNIQFMTLIFLILVGIGSTHYVISNQTDKIVAKILAIEYDKVGGMENYVKINKIQKEQIIAGLKQYEAQNGQIQISQVNNQAIQNTGNKISLEEAEKVVGENTYIIGNTDAEISIVEYSDLECPYCRKLHESGTIEQIIKDYDGKVNFIFKQFPLGFHAQASMEAEAALCVGNLAGGDKYYEFITNVFKNSKTNGKSYDINSISELAFNLGVDKNKFISCINAGTYKDLVKNQTLEGANLFAVTGTPGSVFINNKTGEWNKLSGSYPLESFKQKIDSLIK